MYTMCVGVGPFSIHLLCGPGGLYMYYIKQHVYIFIPIYIYRVPAVRPWAWRAIYKLYIMYNMIILIHGGSYSTHLLCGRGHGGEQHGRARHQRHRLARIAHRNLDINKRGVTR